MRRIVLVLSLVVVVVAGLVARGVLGVAFAVYIRCL